MLPPRPAPESLAPRAPPCRAAPISPSNSGEETLSSRSRRWFSFIKRPMASMSPCSMARRPISAMVPMSSKSPSYLTVSLSQARRTSPTATLVGLCTPVSAMTSRKGR